MQFPRSGRHVVGVGFAVALLAGCAGAESPPQLRPTSDWFDAAACKSDHGVSVDPCSVELTPNQPKANVATTGPKGGKFTYNDTKCVSGDIAQVEGKDNHYVVTAGTVAGKCTATFTDKEPTGKTIGTARLSIAYLKREHCPPTCQLFAITAR